MYNSSKLPLVLLLNLCDQCIVILSITLYFIDESIVFIAFDEVATSVKEDCTENDESFALFGTLSIVNGGVDNNNSIAKHAVTDIE